MGDPFNFSKKFDNDKLANEVYQQIKENTEGTRHSFRQKCFLMMWEYEKRKRLQRSKEEKEWQTKD